MGEEVGYLMKRLGYLIVMLIVLCNIPLAFSVVNSINVTNDVNSTDDSNFVSQIGNTHNANTVVVQIPGTKQFTQDATGVNPGLANTGNETTLQRAINRGLINTQWKPVGYRNDTIAYMGLNGGGNVFVGIGTNEPRARLDVGEFGAIKVGYVPDNVCNVTFKGSIRYNYTSNALQFCNSTNWTNIGTAMAGGAASPPPSVDMGDDTTHVNINTYINTVGICFSGDCRSAWDQIGVGSYVSGAGSGNITGAIATGYILKAKNNSEAMNSALYQSGSNIGIGTIAPSEVLGVSGNISSTGGAYLATSTGNVGIGVTNPGAKLDVAGDVRLSSVGAEIEFNAGGPRLFVPSASTMTFHTGGGLGSAASEMLRLTTTGLGVGSVSPNAKLSVNGSDGVLVNISSATNPQLRLSGTTSIGLLTASDSSGIFVGSASSHPLNFFVNSATRALIDTSGRFVINAPTASTYRLDVNDSNDQQLRVRSSDLYAGITFQDQDSADNITYRGQYGTFAIGGPASGFSVSNKKLHVNGGVTIGSGYAATAVTANSLVVEGSITASSISGSGSGLSTNTVPLDALADCAANQVIKRNAGDTNWVCAADADANSGGTVTSVATGTGLTGGPITATGTISLNLNGGVAQTCGGSQKVSAISATGIVTCSADTDTNSGGTVTSVATGTGLTGGPITATGTVSLNLNGGVAQTCGGSQKISAISATGIVTCSADIDTDTNSGGTITAVSIASANGVSGSSSGGSAPALTIALGAITPSSVTSGAFYYTSDYKLKENINPLTNSLSKIIKLQGVTFNWVDKSQDSGKNIGLIAQDVEKVFPELVSTDKETGFKSVEYGNLVAPLVEAVKEQQKLIDSQSQKLDAQQKQIDKLVARLNALEAK